MVWAPRFKVISRNRLRDNIIAYWNTNQVEALAWAKSTLGFPATPVLTPLTNFYTSTIGRLMTDFPRGMVVNAETTRATDLGDDSYEASRHTFVFEIETYGTDANQIVKDSECYAIAFDSVLRNIPSANLFTGMTQVAGGNIEVTSVFINELTGEQTNGTTGKWTRLLIFTVEIEVIEGQ